MKCKLLLLKIAFVTLIMLVTTEKDLNAVGSYYTEGDYEKTSTYAGIIEDRENIVITNNSNNKFTSSNGNAAASFITKGTKDGRVLYNTILLNNKEEKTKMPERVVNIKTFDEKNNHFDYKSLLKTLKDSFKQKKKPDDWYYYFNFGYSLSCSNILKIASAYNTSGQADGYFSQKTSNGMKGGGFNFETGMKIYLMHLNGGERSFFISPEFFYSRERVNNNSVNYNSRQSAYVDSNYKRVNFAIESNMNIDVKDIYGFALRTGITLRNMFSLYTKFSIGGLNYRITNSVKPMMYNVDWMGITDPLERQKIFDQLHSLEKSKSRTSLLYGIGLGAELSQFNQHLLFKIEYNFYFSSGNYVVDEIFARYGSKDNGVKWRINNNSSSIKITVGFAF